MGIRDRLRRLEELFRDRGPSPEELTAAWERITESARVKLRGDSAEEDQRDRDTLDRWQRATGTDLDTEALRARQRLRDVGRRRT